MPFHKKLNEKSSDPNPAFTFISVLKEFQDADEALELLRALAAQVKPLCKTHGFGVNSFEEAAWNTEWGGRNWNGGEVIEIVLRNRNGEFHPIPWLITVVLHELSHIKEMNHSAKFHEWNNRLRKETREYQRKGYYGDGFWSHGSRVEDGYRSEGYLRAAQMELPHYLCGGASRRKKNTRASRKTHRRQPARKKYQVVKPGSAGGEVTSTRKGPKAGSRVRSSQAFAAAGEGNVISEDPEDSTLRKRAQSKSAKELRADAAERRMQLAKVAKVAKEEEEEPDYHTPSEDERLDEMVAWEQDLEAWEEDDLNDMSSKEEEDELDSDDEVEFSRDEKQTLKEELEEFKTSMRKKRKEAEDVPVAGPSKPKASSSSPKRKRPVHDDKDFSDDAISIKKGKQPASPKKVKKTEPSSPKKPSSASTSKKSTKDNPYGGSESIASYFSNWVQPVPGSSKVKAPKSPGSKSAPIELD